MREGYGRGGEVEGYGRGGEVEGCWRCVVWERWGVWGGGGCGRWRGERCGVGRWRGVGDVWCGRGGECGEVEDVGGGEVRGVGCGNVEGCERCGVWKYEGCESVECGNMKGVECGEGGGVDKPIVLCSMLPPIG